MTFNKIERKILKPKRNVKSDLTYKDMIALDMLDIDKSGDIIIANCGFVHINEKLYFLCSVSSHSRCWGQYRWGWETIQYINIV